jgi:hypothetical protein
MQKEMNAKNSTEEEKTIDFKTIQENWSKYELEDNTIIRKKVILLNIVDYGPSDTPKSPTERKVGFLSNLIVTVFSPKSIRDNPGPVWSVPELEKSIKESNMKFRTLEDGGPSIYETEKQTLQLVNTVIQIDKTSKFDQNGMPAYIVRTRTELLVGGKTEAD